MIKQSLSHPTFIKKFRISLKWRNKRTSWSKKHQKSSRKVRKGQIRLMMFTWGMKSFWKNQRRMKAHLSRSWTLILNKKISSQLHTQAKNYSTIKRHPIHHFKTQRSLILLVLPTKFKGHQLTWIRKGVKRQRSLGVLLHLISSTRISTSTIYP